MFLQAVILKERNILKEYIAIHSYRTFFRLYRNIDLRQYRPASCNGNPYSIPIKIKLDTQTYGYDMHPILTNKTVLELDSVLAYLQ